ncbi:MAG: CapA family protein [Actinomycetota bacterium]|nr:CapA family protein [Actinomycetota bacterium]
MLGRMVAERLKEVPPEQLVSPEVVEATRRADLFLLNLECCISTRGERWPEPGKPFFFRAPPEAVGTLTHLGVDCVTLANNHALDFGHDALMDTFDHLSAAGVEWVGAGPDLERARAPVTLVAGGTALTVVAATDHPQGYAATPDRPGVAYADLWSEVPDWLVSTFSSQPGPVLVTPHWGPNMTTTPLAHIRRAAEAFVDAGAAVVAGHSAHVFHGVSGRVLYDLGDFLDDYAVDAVLRNDLGLLWFLTLDGSAIRRLEALPLKLDYCYTKVAEGEDSEWIRRRFRDACAEFGTEVAEESGLLVVDSPGGG